MRVLQTYVRCQLGMRVQDVPGVAFGFSGGTRDSLMETPGCVRALCRAGWPP
jgi:hypothetical protein